MHKNKGFTLVELLAVIVVLGLLIVLAIPFMNNSSNESKKQAFLLEFEKVIERGKEQLSYDLNTNTSSNTVYAYEMNSDLEMNLSDKYNGYVVVDAGDEENIKYCVYLQNDKYELKRVYYNNEHDTIVNDITDKTTTFPQSINDAKSDCENSYPEVSDDEMTPGLYDDNWKLVASWDLLEKNYNLKIDKDYSNNVNQDNGSDGNSLLYIMNNSTESIKSATKLVIPNKISYIGQLALNRVTLNEINMGDGVITLASNSMYSNNNLKKIKFSSRLKTIGDYALSYNGALEEITLPNSLNSIGRYAIFNNDNLKKISTGNGIKRIDGDAIRNNRNLSEVNIGKNVEYIGKLAFAYNPALEKITIPGNVETIDDRAFMDCKSLKEINLNYGIKSIGVSSFDNAKNVTYLKIPGSVETIGERAFQSATETTSLILENGVKEIGKYAFSSMNKLSYLSIPSSVTKIGDYAFNSSDNLTKLELGTTGDGNIRINDNTFGYLNNVTELILGAGVEDISIGAFRKMTGLLEINVSNDSNVYSSVDGILFDKNQTVVLKYPGANKRESYVFPATVTRAGSQSFYFASYLKKAHFPNSNFYYSSNDFQYCYATITKG